MHIPEFSSESKYPEVKFLSVSLVLNAGACLQMDCDQEGEKKNPEATNQESLRDLRLCLKGRGFWLFEGRIGWGSCKLPNSLFTQHRTGLDITELPVYSDQTAAFDADPSFD